MTDCSLPWPPPVALPAYLCAKADGDNGPKKPPGSSGGCPLQESPCPGWTACSAAWDRNWTVISLPTGISSILAFPKQHLLLHNNFQTWDVWLVSQACWSSLRTDVRSESRHFISSPVPPHLHTHAAWCTFCSSGSPPPTLAFSCFLHLCSPHWGRLQGPTAVGSSSVITCPPIPAQYQLLCAGHHTPHPPPLLSPWSIHVALTWNRKGK